MTERRLLYLNTHHLSAYAWRQGKLLPEGVFEGDDEGLSRFRQYIETQRTRHFSILANVAEEGYALETIPFLHGSDRQKLITRKIGQHFLGTPLATAVSLGYEKARRKNEKILISALTNPGHFNPWLNRIQEFEAPLTGIYTVAQLGDQLLKKLGYAPPRCLLLTVQDHSIRESFLVDGQTLFSRMAPLTDSSVVGIANSLSAEAGKLHQYLIGQRQVGRDAMLPVFVVTHPQAAPAIKQACPDGGQLTFTFVDSHAAAQKIGLHTPPEDSRSELLLLHLLATAPPGQQFAGAVHRHDFHLAQIRQGIIAVGLVAVLASALFSAKEIYRASTLRDETQGLLAAEADLNGRYREISATFPQLDVDNETLRRLTNRHAELTRQQRQPGPAYQMLSQVLSETPHISLEGLEWKIAETGQSTAASLSGNEEVITVRGAIQPPPNATARQILAIFEQFLERLRDAPGNTVNILQQPLDMESGRALRGGDSEDEGARPLQFTIAIIWKIAP